MVKLRLRRAGKKKRPVYKIVAADSRASRSGKFLEAIGQYDPVVHPAVIDVKEDRLFSWLKRGAQPTDTMRSLLQRKGLWLKWALIKKGADEATIATALEKWQMLQGEKQQREAARRAKRKAAMKNKKTAAAETPAAPAPAAVPAAAPAPAAEQPAAPAA